VRGDLQPSVPDQIHLRRGSRALALAVQVHSVDGHWVIEMEPSDESELQYFGHLFVATRNALWESEQETDFLRYAQFIAERIQSLTGFDRVMLYRCR
jgi:light-regulated signal transduction histidine kinase (bacteriophytochrome)